MLVTHYYALVAIAGALTAAFLFKPRERTQITAFGGFIAWSLAALLGDQVEVFDSSIEQIETAPNGTELAVQTTGELVAAPVPDEVRYFAAMWALISALALILYIWGVYPPETDQTEVRQ